LADNELPQNPTAPEETPDAPPLKPGFFSRLDLWKDASPPETPAAPAEAPAPAPAPKKKGFLGGLFAGSKDPAPEPEAAPDKGWFARLSERISKTSQSLVGRLLGALGIGAKIDDETLETIEETLIQSDVSMDTTQRIIANLREAARREKIEGRDAVIAAVKREIVAILVKSARPIDPRGIRKPYVVLIVGVNGVGKTTTIGKMAKRCADAGLRPMLVAGDTFRAAAVEQLEIWAKRCGAEYVRGPADSDPASVVYDAMDQALAKGVDIVFVDTAGRLHTKSNLMAELQKVDRVIKKRIPEAPHETLIVLDATVGQNAVQQVEQFSKMVKLDGIVMTKLDGTAKGGILVSIRDRFPTPVTLIGVGEGIDDLRDFDPAQFADALFGPTAPRG
jgi:fused signal recognition particle receptor